MGFTSIWHWIVVLAIVLLLFGAGKIPRLMGDVAKGINAFKKGLKEEGAEEEPKALTSDSAEPAAQAEKDKAKEQSS